jgi:hypothetical protein
VTVSYTHRPGLCQIRSAHRLPHAGLSEILYPDVMEHHVTGTGTPGNHDICLTTSLPHSGFVTCSTNDRRRSVQWNAYRAVIQALGVPDKVTSRLGELTFRDGAPTSETVPTVYDHLDFVHALNASTRAGPSPSSSSPTAAPSGRVPPQPQGPDRNRNRFPFAGRRADK